RRERGNRNRVTEHADIKHAAAEAGYVRIEFRNESDGPHCKKKSQGGSGAREQDAFREKLANDAPARGAERETDGNFFLAAGRAGHHEIRRVQAGNQEHAEDCGPEDKQALANFLRELHAQWNDTHANAAVIFWIFLRKTLRNSIHLRLRLRPAGARVQPADDTHVGILPHVEFPEGKGRLDFARLPELGALGKRESARHHTNDCVALSVAEPQLPPESVWITGEARFPKRVADDHDVRFAAQGIVDDKSAAENGIHA